MATWFKCSTEMTQIKDLGVGLEPQPVQGDDPLAPWASPATVQGPPENIHTFTPGSETQSNSTSANNPCLSHSTGADNGKYICIYI